jgi:hypothetical protein
VVVDCKFERAWVVWAFAPRKCFWGHSPLNTGFMLRFCLSSQYHE